jgi:CRP-like cAMP-binding protein
MQERQKLIDFIRQTFPMPLQDAEAIANGFSVKHFEKNELLVKEGKICNEYYFLDEGFARAFTHDIEGNDITTALYASNNVVCELFSFFKRVPSKESIQALTECKAWRLTFDELQDVFHSMVLFREFGRTILINSYASLKQRMLSALQETAEERYAHLIKTNPDVFQYVPLKHIATYLGVTDTSLSRIRKEFSKTN